VQDGTTAPARAVATVSGWRLPIVLGVIPLCPICTERLSPTVTEFLGQFAFCGRCAAGNRRIVKEALDAMHDPVLACHLTVTRNLRFYTPRRTPVVAAFQLAIEERMRLR
jgi:hypothetical protein